MDELGADVASILTNLMPGFVFAWVFYSLTTHRKPNQFDQVIHALIATALLHATVQIEASILIWLGEYICLGSWTRSSELSLSFMTAVAAGLTVSQLSRRDAIFRMLRGMGLTARNHNSSEWCSVLEQSNMDVVLHLKGDRRIYGWPLFWPSDHKQGHFYLADAEWLDDENNRSSASGVEGILINVEDVEIVECVKGDKA